jgi:fructose-1,6-bisphosphatase/sedoheptulose 1,7-bisphosphatase-like protein
LLLQETGYQAAQHEIIGDTLTGKLHQELQQKAKEIMKATKHNLKKAKQISEDINKVYKDQV